MLGTGAFGRWLGHEGEALISEFGALMEETPESSFIPPLHVRLQWKDGHLWTKTQPFFRHWVCSYLDFIFFSLQNYEK